MVGWRGHRAPVMQGAADRAPMARLVIARAAVALLVMMPLAAGAQSSRLAFGLPAEFEAGLVYRSWSLAGAEGEVNLRQVALPVHVRTALTPRLEFSYLFRAAVTDMTDLAIERRLHGLADGLLGATYTLPDPRFSVGASFRVPSGKNALDPSETTVLDALNDRLLGFYIKRYGEGPDVELRGTYADAPQPGLAYGGGVSVTAKGAFDVTSRLAPGGLARYEPGAEWSVFGALELIGARRWQATARVTGFLEDRRDGVRELAEGTQLDVDLGFRQEFLRGELTVGAGFVAKAETEFATPHTPIRDVAGSIFRADAAFSGWLDGRTRLGGRAAYSGFGENDAGTGDGWVVELGPTGSRELGHGFGLQVGYAFLVGEAENGTIDMSGHGGVLALTAGAVR